MAMKNLLLTIFLIGSYSFFGQVKIGNIEVSDSVAQRYFLYCYQHPDTVYTQNDDTYIHEGGNTIEAVQSSKARAMAFNMELLKNSIGKLPWSIPQRYLVPQKPSETGLVRWQFTGIGKRTNTTVDTVVIKTNPNITFLIGQLALAYNHTWTLKKSVTRHGKTDWYCVSEEGRTAWILEEKLKQL